MHSTCTHLDVPGLTIVSEACVVRTHGSRRGPRGWCTSVVVWYWFQIMVNTSSVPLPHLTIWNRTQRQMEPHFTTLGSAQAFQISRHPTRVLFKTFVALPTGVGISFSQRREPRAYPLPPPPLSPPSVVVIAGGQHPAPMQPASRFFNNSA